MWKKHWIAIVSLVVTTTSLGLAVYFYYGSKFEREPKYYIHPDRTEILNFERVNEAPIKIVRRDGKQVKNDVTAFKFSFWNAGKKPIRRSHIVNPIRLIAADSSCEILDIIPIKVTDSSVSRLQVVLDSTMANRAALIGFEILEYEYGGTFQITFEGNRQTEFTVTGHIEEVYAGISSVVGSRRKWTALGYILIILSFSLPGFYFILRLKFYRPSIHSLTVYVRLSGMLSMITFILLSLLEMLNPPIMGGLLIEINPPIPSHLLP